ncbi:TPA: hypothetical protein MW242_003089 [Acinetobacter baumannii]|nr:hypothetical protein [Acinetobacter baumannii]
MTIFQIKHSYGIIGHSLQFSLNSSFTDAEVIDLAVFLQFKAEEIISEMVTLDLSTVVNFLAYYGAAIINSPSDSSIEIDMYTERSKRCGKWYVENFDRLDIEYGQKATEYLDEIAELFFSNHPELKTAAGAVI